MALPFEKEADADLQLRGVTSCCVVFVGHFGRPVGTHPSIEHSAVENVWLGDLILSVVQD
jgi:hypothetical protein